MAERVAGVMLDVDGRLVDSDAAHARAWADVLDEARFWAMSAITSNRLAVAAEYGRGQRRRPLDERALRVRDARRAYAGDELLDFLGRISLGDP